MQRSPAVIKLSYLFIMCLFLLESTLTLLNCILQAATSVSFFYDISVLLCSLFQVSGPIKEKDGRVRHFKGVSETVPQETSLGNSLCKFNPYYVSLIGELRLFKNNCV